jgi:hypothetical protein
MRCLVPEVLGIGVDSVSANSLGPDPSSRGKRREGIGHVGNLCKVDISANGIAARPIDLVNIFLMA